MLHLKSNGLFNVRNPLYIVSQLKNVEFCTEMPVSRMIQHFLPNFFFLRKKDFFYTKMELLWESLNKI